MPWGNRQHPSDSGHKNEYGTRKCPRCGREVSTCAFGYKSHLKACLKRTVVVRGKTYPPVKGN
jgi:hypothetical protein